MRYLPIMLVFLLLSACANLPEPAGPGTWWGQRYDVYDAQSNRIGYGRVSGGTVDLFDARSNRIGTIRAR